MSTQIGRAKDVVPLRRGCDQRIVRERQVVSQRPDCTVLIMSGLAPDGTVAVRSLPLDDELLVRERKRFSDVCVCLHLCAVIHLRPAGPRAECVVLRRVHHALAHVDVSGVARIGPEVERACAELDEVVRRPERLPLVGQRGRKRLRPARNGNFHLGRRRSRAERHCQQSRRENCSEP